MGAESHHLQQPFKFDSHFNLCVLLMKGIYEAKMDYIKKKKKTMTYNPVVNNLISNLLSSINE